MEKNWINVRRSTVETYRERKVSIVLEEDCHRSSEIDQFEGLDVFSVDKDFTFSSVVDSGDELQNGAFP